MSKIAGIAILMFAPFKLCEALNLPLPFQTCRMITGMTTAYAIFIQHIQEDRENEIEYQKTTVKRDQEFEDARRWHQQAFAQFSDQVKSSFKEMDMHFDAPFGEFSKE